MYKNNTKSSAVRNILFSPKMLVCLFIGFASGLPLYFLVQLIPAWLRNYDIDLSTIGLFSLIMFSYNWKFVWSPIMERFTPPFLGKRRGWMLLTQIPLIISSVCLMFLHPQQHIIGIAAVVALIGFFSASQDIVLDAYRRDFLEDEELAMGTSIHVNAYRLSSLIPGGLALILSDYLSWQFAIGISIAFLLIGLFTTLLIKEPQHTDYRPSDLSQAVIEPFKEFFMRDGWRTACLILLFLVLYKLGDNMATALETPFFYDLGFNGTQIGSVAKLSKLWASVLGAALGGWFLVRYGLNRSLWVFGFFQIISILGYACLAYAGNQIWVLFAAVSLEYLGVGLGTVGVTTYIAHLTNRQFTATQFALLSSLATLPRTFANASTGFIIESVGYVNFFLICFCCAIPGMLLLFKIAPWNSREPLNIEQSDKIKNDKKD